MADQFSGCEIVELGVQIEKNGYAFYSELAAVSEDPEVAALFKSLAEAEEDHIAMLKSIAADTLCEYGPEGDYPEEYFAYMNAIARQHILLQEEKGHEIAKKVKNAQEALAIGIQLEKDSILFYQEMKKVVADKDKALVDKLVQEEQDHLDKLTKIMGRNK